MKYNTRYSSKRRWRPWKTYGVIAIAIFVMYLLISSMWGRGKKDVDVISTHKQVTQIPRIKPNGQVGVHEDVIYDRPADEEEGDTGQVPRPPANDQNQVENLGSNALGGPILKVDNDVKDLDKVLADLASIGGVDRTQWSLEHDYPQLATRYANVPLQPNTEISNVVQVVENIVYYFINNIEEQTTDAFFALRMFQGQIEVLFAKLGERGEAVDDVSMPLIKTLYDSRNAAKIMLASADRIVSKTTPNYTDLIGLYQPDTWNIYNPAVQLQKQLSEDKQLLPKIPTLNTDKCMSQIIGSGEYKKVCSVDDQCWTEMTASGMSDFGATRQLLYLLTGQGHHCDKVMNDLAAKSKQISVPTLVDTFCANIYAEITPMLGKKSAETLVFEQIFMCGMFGYKEFCLPQAFQSLMTSQTPSGCYADSESFLERAYHKLLSLMGLMETEPSGNAKCSSHKTSAALGAAMQYIRCLIEDPSLKLGSD